LIAFATTSANSRSAGTATGTGLNTHEEFPGRAAEYITKETGVQFREADNHFEAQAAHDAMSEAHGALRTVAGSLNKIANDLRLLASGPRNGLGEIEQPENQPGSSIMPGKINPVVAEAVNQVHKQVVGNDAAVSAGAAEGQIDLNLYKPVLAHNFLESAELISNASQVFGERFVRKLEANEEYCESRVEQSMAMATSLNVHIGYDKASEVAKTALKEDKTVRDVVLEKGISPKRRPTRCSTPENDRARYSRTGRLNRLIEPFFSSDECAAVSFRPSARISGRSDRFALVERVLDIAHHRLEQVGHGHQTDDLPILDHQRKFLILGLKLVDRVADVHVGESVIGGAASSSKSMVPSASSTMPDENRRVDDSAEISQLLADERIPRLGSLLHLPEIFFGGVLSRQRNDLLGDTITSRIGFSDLERVHHLFAALVGHVPFLEHGAESVPEIRPGLDDVLFGLEPRAGHLDPEEFERQFRDASPSVMTGEMIQWNQYSGAAPYRQTSRDRSTPRYVGVCSRGSDERG